MKNKTEFAKYMLMMSELFNKELSKPIKEIYWKALEPYSDADCIAVFNKAILSCTFFPKPAELIELIKPKQAMSDQAELAWIDVESAVKSHGPYASVKFDNPVIHGVIDALGGWVKFQDVTMNNWVWVKKEFVKLYPILAGRGGYPDTLPGQIEMDNTALGYDNIKPAVQISCKSIERKLIEEG